MTLPDCMMPDGAEPCKGYRELQEAAQKQGVADGNEITRLRAELAEAQLVICAMREVFVDIYSWQPGPGDFEKYKPYLEPVAGHAREKAKDGYALTPDSLAGMRLVSVETLEKWASRTGAYGIAHLAEEIRAMLSDGGSTCSVCQHRLSVHDLTDCDRDDCPLPEMDRAHG